MADTNPPEQLLTPAEVHELRAHIDAKEPRAESPEQLFALVVREVERALLARLSEQQPVCWGIFDQAGFLEEAMDEAGAKRSVKYYNTMGPLTPYTCRPLYAAPVPTPAAQAAQAVPADTQLLDFLAAESLDLRCFTVSDDDVGWRTVQHHQGKPAERVASAVYCDDPRQAIREAMQRLQRDPYCTGPLHQDGAAPTPTSQEQQSGDQS